ncbi:MAG: ABC transporter ATP-binding protein [Elusimicrobia bacterium RIFCSPHIGHO2_02_FULL_57_9]|nr:MAG: ABC transporter ATP-binding protein [Elusimicrobia bacterium RIFCSPHIGHO2_02_FULL_57_9]
MSSPQALGPILELKELHCVYGKKIRALKGVSLEVCLGEIVALIGNNGAGKTTMMRAIAGQLKPEQGTVNFSGRSIGGMPAHEIVRLGVCLVPEGRRIFPRLSVMENLEMGAYARPRADFKQEYEHVFGLFPVLGERRRQLGGTLSGGEQQMLAIGRAMMAAPKLLMLDEPSMGLAPVIVDKVFETISRINKEGVTIFLVEQNAKRALAAASRAYVMETGQIVLSGSASVLADNPSIKKAYLGLQ